MAYPETFIARTSMGSNLGSLRAYYARKPDHKSNLENFMGYSVKALTAVTFIIKELKPLQGRLYGRRKPVNVHTERIIIAVYTHKAPVSTSGLSTADDL